MWRRVNKNTTHYLNRIKSAGWFCLKTKIQMTNVSTTQAAIAESLR